MSQNRTLEEEREMTSQIGEVEIGDLDQQLKARYDGGYSMPQKFSLRRLHTFHP